MRFSKRIDRWHDEQSKLNSGVFEEDRDFVELDHSPSRFSNLPADQHSSLDEFLLGSNNGNNNSNEDHQKPEEPKAIADKSTETKVSVAVGTKKGSSAASSKHVAGVPSASTFSGKKSTDSNP